MHDYDSKQWLAYFEEKDKDRLRLDFSGEPDLTEEQALLIFPSIQAFQTGERSEGTHLMKEVHRFVQKSGDMAYLECMKRFIREENWHSAYLKQYLNCYRVPDMEICVLDQCFRELRRFAGLKGEIMVLVTAEIIALSYYRALAVCVPGGSLLQICRQMLKDELPHIVFQAGTLRKLGFGRTDALLLIGLMEGVTGLTWAAFGNVLQRGGYSFSSYAKENLGYVKQLLAMVIPGAARMIGL